MSEKYNITEIGFEMYKEYCISKRKKPELEPESYAEYWLRDVIENPTDDILDGIFEVFMAYLTGPRDGVNDIE